MDSHLGRWQAGTRCISGRMAGELRAVLEVPIPMRPIRPEELGPRSLRAIRRRGQPEPNPEVEEAKPYDGPRFLKRLWGSQTR